MIASLFFPVAALAASFAPTQTTWPDAVEAAARSDGRMVAVAVYVEDDAEARARLESALADPIVQPFLARHVVLVSILDDEIAAGRESWRRPVTGVATLEFGNLSPRAVQDGPDLLGHLRHGRVTDRVMRSADEALAKAHEERDLEILQAIGRAKFEGDFDALSALLFRQWDHLTAWGMTPVRSSFLRSELRRLAAMHEPTRVELETRRAALAPIVTSNAADDQEYREWVDLVCALGRGEELFDWLRVVREWPDARWHLQQLDFELRRILVEGERYADLLALSLDPAEDIRESIRSYHELVELTGGHHPGLHFQEARMILRGLLRAGRGDLAAELAEQIAAADATAANVMPLVEVLLDEGLAHPAAAKWLEAARVGATRMVERRIQRLLERISGAAGEVRAR
jgi:hypothetical protein